MALVDLAGSERLKRTESIGVQRDEAVSINRSLTALGDVLHGLVNKADHVPYRNSKLTSLLQPCLRRGCRVAIIVAASISRSDACETINTLAFGVRARTVTLGPVGVTRSGSGCVSLSAGNSKDVERLTHELQEAQQAATVAAKSAANSEDQLKSLGSQVKRAEQRAREAEVAMERRNAQMQTEQSRWTKEKDELKRRLMIANRPRLARSNVVEAKAPQPGHTNMIEDRENTVVQTSAFGDRNNPPLTPTSTSNPNEEVIQSSRPTLQQLASPAGECTAYGLNGRASEPRRVALTPSLTPNAARGAPAVCASPRPRWH